MFARLCWSVLALERCKTGVPREEEFRLLTSMEAGRATPNVTTWTAELVCWPKTLLHVNTLAAIITPAESTFFIVPALVREGKRNNAALRWNLTDVRVCRKRIADGLIEFAASADTRDDIDGSDSARQIDRAGTCGLAAGQSHHQRCSRRHLVADGRDDLHIVKIRCETILGVRVADGGETGPRDRITDDEGVGVACDGNLGDGFDFDGHGL